MAVKIPPTKRKAGVVYAEDLPYWQSSQTAPDTWMERSIKLIAKLGGKVVEEAFSNVSGAAAYRLSFVLDNHLYRVEWPVFESLHNRAAAAKIQAATFLYHDVKHRFDLVKAKGARRAFFEYLMLPDGRTISEASDQELGQLALPAGKADDNIIDGEIVE